MLFTRHANYLKVWRRLDIQKLVGQQTFRCFLDVWMFYEPALPPFHRTNQHQKTVLAKYSSKHKNERLACFMLTPYCATRRLFLHFFIYDHLLLILFLLVCFCLCIHNMSRYCSCWHWGCQFVRNDNQHPLASTGETKVMKKDAINIFHSA